MIDTAGGGVGLTVAVGAAPAKGGSRTFQTANPFGPVPPNSPYNPPSSGRDSRTVGTGSRPTVNPFGPAYPTPAQTPEPLPARKSSFASQQPFAPLPESPPASQTYKMALVAILTASVMLGGALVYFGFLNGNLNLPAVKAK